MAGLYEKLPLKGVEARKPGSGESIFAPNSAGQPYLRGPGNPTAPMPNLILDDDRYDRPYHRRLPRTKGS